MLKLKEIRIKDNFIEAHYTPEDSSRTGFLKLNDKAEVIELITVEGYESTYPLMAKRALKEIFELSKINSDYKIPNEKLVMWY